MTKRIQTETDLPIAFRKFASHWPENAFLLSDRLPSNLSITAVYSAHSMAIPCTFLLILDDMVPLPSMQYSSVDSIAIDVFVLSPPPLGDPC